MNPRIRTPRTGRNPPLGRRLRRTQPTRATVCYALRRVRRGSWIGPGVGAGHNCVAGRTSTGTG